MRKRILRAVRGVLRRFGAGVEVRRDEGKLQLEIQHPRLTAPTPEPGAVAPLFGDPLDALFHRYGGKPAAFDCPLDQCVDVNGLNFHTQGWHPFVATLREYIDGEITGYRGSTLERYYQTFQPANLLEAFIGIEQADRSSLDALPSYLTYLYPWSAKSVIEADKAIKQNFHHDYAEHGRPELTVERHGCAVHGPVSDEVGQLQFNRLTHVYHSLMRHGYRREFGDVRVLAVQRNGGRRYLVSGGGLHRTAAMVAFGYRTVPATFNNVPTIFDAADIPRWRQVAAGVWSPESARAYVDHLFDFDAYRWAEREGLARNANACRGAP